MSITDEPEKDKRKRPPFAAIPWRLIDAKVGPYAIAVYAVIARHADREGHARPSMQRIADLAGVSRPTARSAVRALEAAGLLVVTSAKNEHGVDMAHRYHLIGSGNGVSTSGNQIAGEGQPGCQGSGNGVSREGQPGCHELEPIELEPIEQEPLNQKSAAKAASRSKKSGCDVPIPEALDTPEFKEQWQAWIRHLRESRKSLSATSAESQLSELSEWGRDRAIAAIRHSIRKGYKGIYEPNNASSNKPTSARSKPGTGAGVLFDPNAATTDPSYGAF